MMFLHSIFDYKKDTQISQNAAIMIITARNSPQASLQTTRSFLLLASLALLVPFCTVNAAENGGVVSATTHIKDDNGKPLGVIRSHVDSYITSCSTVLFLGVGTFMTVSDYDKIAQHIVTAQPIVAIVLDQNVDHVVKTSATEYALLVNAVERQISNIVPICQEGVDSIIGGHSASGQAAVAAWQMGLFGSNINLVGFVGLDPYEISSKTIDDVSPLDLPSLFWGFTQSTCLVAPEKAARAAYELTEMNARVLYTINNEHGSEITHCVFTDRGCGVGPIGCPKKRGFEWIFEFVAESIHRFVYAIQSPSKFTKSTFELNSANASPYDVGLDVNKDQELNEKTSSEGGNDQAALGGSVF
jgi:hypothetical protein